jgi:hypothetical protein
MHHIKNHLYRLARPFLLLYIQPSAMCVSLLDRLIIHWKPLARICCNSLLPGREPF